jgi:peptidyl-prolyl cis-trans isomerase B (cyclophilin B)
VTPDEPAARPVPLPPDPAHTPDHGKVGVTLATNQGLIPLSLNRAQAPCTVQSFLHLTKHHFYDFTTCHRLTSYPTLKVLQCGDPTGTGEGGPGYEVVQAPPKNLKYTLGTVAMAKTAEAPAGAAGSQFYVVSGPQGETLPPEYALAGKVTKGLDVIERIGALGTPEEKPTEPVVIEKMTIERG